MTFAGRMLEARRLKQEAHNAGLAGGDFRGTVRVRRPDDLGALEQDIARVVHAEFGWRGRWLDDLQWAVLEINDPTIYELRI
jgi:hypothetical protein